MLSWGPLAFSRNLIDARYPHFTQTCYSRARTPTSQHASAIRNVTNSNFGKLTGQTNLPRNVQIGLKLIF